LEDFLDDVDLQVALSQQPLEAGILFFEFTHAGSLVCVHAAEASAPAIERVFGNVVLAADIGDRFLALFGLLLEKNDKMATICSSVN
jgi:hypothetical protein